MSQSLYYLTYGHERLANSLKIWRKLIEFILQLWKFTKVGNFFKNQSLVGIKAFNRIANFNRAYLTLKILSCLWPPTSKALSKDDQNFPVLNFPFLTLSLFSMQRRTFQKLNQLLHYNFVAPCNIMWVSTSLESSALHWSGARRSRSDRIL